jgi:hypothetical protein
VTSRSPLEENDVKPAIVLTSLLLTLPLGCGGQDKAAVCDSVGGLKASVADLKGIEISSSRALTDLESGIKAIQDDLAAVKADATSEFSSQIDVVETGFATLKTSVGKATTAPSGATLAAAGSAASALGTDVQTLISDIQDTC